MTDEQLTRACVLYFLSIGIVALGLVVTLILILVTHPS